MKRKISNIIRGIVFVVALAVFLFSGYKLFTIFMEYQKGEDEYREIVKEVVVEEGVGDNLQTEEMIAFKVDFEKLLEMNKETVAWIRFDNPSQISYPILQTDNNEKYLKTTFEQKKNAAGAIFMDAENAKDFVDRNTIIYGHNMKNGSMFGKLRAYKKYDFFRENPYFYIYTPNGLEHKYQIFAVDVVEEDALNYRRQFANDQEYMAYLKKISTMSLYHTGVEISTESKIITLSTCTNVTDTQRLVVHGVRVEEKVAGE